jgi:CRP-like cAMP-binding protein
VKIYRVDANGALPITQEDLAQLAGTTCPTANRVLVGLQSAGVIHLQRGRIEVTDIAELRRLAR